MSRDHLLPPVFARERFGAPYRTTILTGVAVASLAFFVELKTLAELVNIGTLFAFIVVALGVLVLRRSSPISSAPTARRSCRWRRSSPCWQRCG